MSVKAPVGKRSATFTGRIIKIDHELSALIPPLSSEEQAQLKANLLTDGCRDPLVTWKGILLDGHNRHQICEAHDIPYETTTVDLPDRSAAILWVIHNQLGRRNLAPYARCELALRAEPLIKAKAKANQRAAGGAVPKKSSEAVETREEIAKEARVSHDTLTKAKVIAAKADEETKARLRTGDLTINKAFTDLHREKRRAEAHAKLDDIGVQKVKELAGVYDVIVVDPPWPIQKIERDVRPNQTAMDYPTMSEDELAELDIPYANDCHVWLWTTHKMLPTAFRLLDHWGLKYVCTFVWHKPGGFQPVGLPQYNCEFALRLTEMRGVDFDQVGGDCKILVALWIDIDDADISPMNLITKQVEWEHCTVRKTPVANSSSTNPMHSC